MKSIARVSMTLEIDIDNLTPVEALNKLYNIKKLLK